MGLLSCLTTLFFACSTRAPCGTFAFSGTPDGAGASVQVDFSFDPAACGATCTCNTVAYIQIVRVIDLDSGAFLAANSEQQNRIVTGQASATLNGWYVDRSSGKIWGYYGRNNDGGFGGLVTTGSNTTAAVLRDFPANWHNNNWFEAISVPVCIDRAATCCDRLLGFYDWLFGIDGNGVASDLVHGPAQEWSPDAVNLAVVEWNNDAAALGKNELPAMTPLP